MRDSLVLKFLYKTVPGRICLKILTRPVISKIAGSFLDSGFSAFLIEPFAKMYKINLDGIDMPAEGFYSFNEFFTRKKLDISFDEKNSHLISPSDGFLSVYKIDRKSRFEIKHTKFSVSDLLGDKKLAKDFSGGTALIYRLTPSNYHRYIFIDDGKIIKHKKIRGVLHTVRPIAIERYPVYVQNSREVTIIDTNNFGTIAQVEIGALLIGRITNDKKKGRVKRGEEKGYFEFGGSTIVILLKKDAADIKESKREKLVSIGDLVGKR